MIEKETKRELDRIDETLGDSKSVTFDPPLPVIPYARVLPAGTGTWGFTDFAFGFSISGAVVTVNAGKVRHGKRVAVTATGKDITIAVDQTWVFVTYVFAGGATITSSTSEPVDTEGVHNRALYLVTLTAGVASVEPGDISHLGDIWLPGNFG